MKKLSIVLAAAAFCFSSLMPSASFAQKEQGKSVINVGVGYSLIGSLFRTVYSTSSYPGIKNTSVPPINLSYDFGISDKFSLGGAFAMEKIAFKWVDAVDVWNGSTYVPTNYDYQAGFTRMNIAVRPLFHFGNSDDLDIYSGLRVGFNNWSTVWKTSDPNMSTAPSGVSLGNFGVQVLFGMRYFFNEHFGVQSEIGIGAPYVAEFGMAIGF